MSFVMRVLWLGTLSVLMGCQSSHKLSDEAQGSKPSEVSEQTQAYDASQPVPTPRYEELSAEINVTDAKKLVEYLASAEMKGRMTGSEEEKKYQETLKALSKKMGLKPGASKSSWTSGFEFTKGIAVPPSKNQLTTVAQDMVLEKDWVPVGGSKSGKFKAEDVVFVGYGMKVPADGDVEAYSSYTGKEVLAGQWFVMLRDIPSEVDEKTRAHYFRYSRREHKIRIAEQKRAAGVIFLTGPKSGFSNELIDLNYDAATGEHGVPVLSMTMEAFNKILENPESLPLDVVQARLDGGEKMPMQRLQTNPFNVSVELEKQKASGASFLALLKVPGAKSTVVVGAHGDHLGDHAHASGSLRSAETTDTIHYGADDNASGVSGVMEIAHHLSHRVKTKKTKLRQNVLFAVWSGEELGTLGSSAWLKTAEAKRLKVSAYLNMDMIGRMDKSVTIQGTGSSKEWEQMYLKKMATQNALPVTSTRDPYLPTDGMSFYLNEIPSLSFFTGAHSDYHKPTDTAEKLNYQGIVSIAGYVAEMTEMLASRSQGPSYQKVERKSTKGKGRGFRIFLGTIPDYSQEGVTGVRLQGVIKGGPAERAGLKSGDIIVKFSSHNVKSLYDYVYTLQVVKPGKATTITVLRNGKSVDLPITPSIKK